MPHKTSCIPLGAELALQKQLDQSKAFASGWTTDLIQAMDAELDDKAIASILTSCGRACAERNSAPLITTYSGDLDGFLAKMHELWLESFEHDREQGTITVVGREMEECPCPVHPAVGAGSYCECSNGHMEHLFSEIIGTPVQVELDESLIRGAKRCSWTIGYARG